MKRRVLALAVGIWAAVALVSQAIADPNSPSSQGSLAGASGGAAPAGGPSAPQAGYGGYQRTGIDASASSQPYLGGLNGRLYGRLHYVDPRDYPDSRGYVGYRPYQPSRSYASKLYIGYQPYESRPYTVLPPVLPTPSLPGAAAFGPQPQAVYGAGNDTMYGKKLYSAPRQ